MRDAEEIVRRAWRLELLRQRDRIQFAVRAAEHDCDSAHQVLAAAQRDGDPRVIAAAHDALEQALDTARRSAAVWERTSQALRTELGLLAGADTVRPVTAPVSRLAGERSAPSAPASVTPGIRSHPVRRLLMVLPSERGVYRWLRRLAMRRTTALGSDEHRGHTLRRVEAGASGAIRVLRAGSWSAWPTSGWTRRWPPTPRRGSIGT